MIRIIPKAANAFDIELLRWNGKEDVVVGKLELHSDGEVLYILKRDGKFSVRARGKVKKVKTHHLEINVSEE